MTKLEQYFQTKKNVSAFMPYFSLGDPKITFSFDWADALVEGGANILELGIPFSDPIGDGPVVQRAFTRAFQNQFSFETIFPVAKKIHEAHSEVPLVFMTYFNPIGKYGLEHFLDHAAESGISGLILPDMPFDTPESERIFHLGKSRGINLIHLVTPSTSAKRIKSMRGLTGGFVYYVTSFGVTGERKEFSADLKDRIEFVKAELKLPVCAGFGISTPEHAKLMSEFSDGVIIGSAVQKIIEEHGNSPEVCKSRLQEYAKQIRAAFP